MGGERTCIYFIGPQLFLTCHQPVQVCPVAVQCCLDRPQQPLAVRPGVEGALLQEGSSGPAQRPATAKSSRQDRRKDVLLSINQKLTWRQKHALHSMSHLPSNLLTAHSGTRGRLQAPWDAPSQNTPPKHVAQLQITLNFLQHDGCQHYALVKNCYQTAASVPHAHLNTLSSRGQLPLTSPSSP